MAGSVNPFESVGRWIGGSLEREIVLWVDLCICRLLDL